MLRGLVKSIKSLTETMLQRGFKGFSYMPGMFLKPNAWKWEKEFKKNTFIRSPIHRISEDTSRIRWHLYRRSKTRQGKRQEVFKHPALDVWNHPCPYMTGTNMRYLYQAWDEIHGEFFGLLDMEDGKDPTAVWPTPPHYVWRIPCFDLPNYNLVFPSGENLDVEPSGMLYWCRPDPEMPYGRGAGAAGAIAEQVEQLDWMSKFNSALFRNGAHPGQILAVEGLTAANEDKVKAAFAQSNGGYMNAFKTQVLSGRIQVIQKAPPPKELDFDKGNRRLRDTVNQNWQLPPEIMGIIENSNRATIDGALNFYQRQILLPRMEHQREFWNTYYLPLFGDDALELDFEPPVHETEQFRLDKADRGLISGALQVNDWLQTNGMDPVKGGDIRFVPKNTVPVTAAQLSDPDVLKELFAKAQPAPFKPAQPGGQDEDAQQEPQTPTKGRRSRRKAS